MIFRFGNIITDGEIAKLVDERFSNWHSDMRIDEIDGVPCEVPEGIKREVARWKARAEADRSIVHDKPLDFSWIPKRKHGLPRVPTKRELR